ncbi:MAG: phosphoribosylaminoimidazolesuccinocarboxamide synthase [Ferruginibacter sp.]
MEYPWFFGLSSRDGNAPFPAQTAYYQGKVRDVYTIADQYIVLIASNRLSAFDVILPKPIPFKGQVLNRIAAHMLQACQDICPIWLISSPAPHVSIGYRCEPIKLELVVRGTLTGHAWRTYQSGQRMLCGAVLPEGMREHDFFPEPIITPSTKAEAGHDEDITPIDIIERGLVSETEWEQLKEYAVRLFQRGQALSAERGLILADTKYEFGKRGNELVLMDEIHTPDSSRYFIQDGFDERQASGMKQTQLSKEFVREWLIENGFMGKPGQSVPPMTESWINTISNRYIELYEKLIGKPFEPQPWTDEQTTQAVTEAIQPLLSK